MQNFISTEPWDNDYASNLIHVKNASPDDYFIYTVSGEAPPSCIETKQLASVKTKEEVFGYFRNETVRYTAYNETDEFFNNPDEITDEYLENEDVATLKKLWEKLDTCVDEDDILGEKFRSVVEEFNKTFEFTYCYEEFYFFKGDKELKVFLDEYVKKNEPDDDGGFYPEIWKDGKFNAEMLENFAFESLYYL